MTNRESLRTSRECSNEKHFTHRSQLYLGLSRGSQECLSGNITKAYRLNSNEKNVKIPT